MIVPALKHSSSVSATYVRLLQKHSGMGGMGLAQAEFSGSSQAFPAESAHERDACEITSHIALDGSPIYDSRVAATIAALVELWRRHQSLNGPFPPELTFSATAFSRTALHLFDDA
jgi:hypothetical protein